MVTKEAKIIRVLIADDQPMLSQMYKQVLESDGMEVVAEASSVEETIAKYIELKPDVLLLDIRFGPGENGFDAMTKIIEVFPTAKIAIISQYDMTPYISRAYKLGAKTFLTKACSPEILIAAVRKIESGEWYYMDGIAETIIKHDLTSSPDPKVVLDARDFEIFLLLAKGKTNVEIADDLKHLPNYVSTRRQKIQIALNIDRPQHFSILAIQYGHISL